MGIVREIANLWAWGGG